MFKTEIDKLFTRKVAEYLGKGYRVHTDTMSGSQGEIAKVDLANGNEVVRVLFDREYSLHGERVSVKVGRNTDSLRGLDGDTIWNKNLEILEKAVFYKIGDNYYVTPEEYEAIYAKRMKRWEARHQNRYSPVILSDAAKEIVLPFVRRQPKCGRVKIRDIERVYRSVSPCDNRPTYYVDAKGKRFRLR